MNILNSHQKQTVITSLTEPYAQYTASVHVDSNAFYMRSIGSVGHDMCTSSGKIVKSPYKASSTVKMSFQNLEKNAILKNGKRIKMHIEDELISLDNHLTPNSKNGSRRLLL